MMDFKILQHVRFIAVFILALFLSGCLKPVYQNSSGSTEVNNRAPSAFGQLSFSQPTTREAQLIIQDLGLKLSDRSAQKLFRLEINIDKSVRRLTTTTTDNPRAANIANINAHFVLRRIADEAIIVNERRFAQASYNTTGQGVADDQALVNANERAARQIAQLIRAKLLATLAQDEIKPLEDQGPEVTIIRQ